MNLPPDVLLLIFQQCPAKTQAALERVCRHFRDLVKHVPVQLHITPANETEILRWASGRDVTKVCGRRLSTACFPSLCFPTLRVLDVMFMRIPAPCTLPPGLARVRIHRLWCGDFMHSTFRVSTHLPASVVDADITFESSWQAVCVDRGVPKLTLRAYPPGPMDFRQPDFLVTDARGIREVSLTTYGNVFVYVNPEDPKTIRRARIECEDGPRDVSTILSLFDKSLDMLVMRVPNASILWSKDLAHLDPTIVAIACDFLGIDAYGPRLRELELDVDRLAYVQLPPHVTLNISIRHTYIDPSFFT
jgi:hypothetical protein